ncbi:MAG: hypothetical protein CM1200mP20_02180 [Pseudomonadota bacterium]|nr:MAG: hypothetical protein CM1200mP20_02180 [Pseudomonadota bacterium]
MGRSRSLAEGTGAGAYPELAAQVESAIVTYGKICNFDPRQFWRCRINPQKSALQRGIDIVVATPGRLLDLVDQRSIDLSSIKILVLDEADRMLDMGFIHDIRKVLGFLPKHRQNLLFSATYTRDIKRLADSLLNKPAMVEVERRTVAAQTVNQCAYRVDKSAKRDLLIQLINEGRWHQVLVFTRTKHGANRLAEQLVRRGIDATAIHGNKSQAARTRALAGFKKGSLRVLVATDIAARGLDIDRLPHVVNYELPNVPEDYVHRIGRTGRAGEEGEAVSLVGADEVRLLKDIERLLRKEIPLQALVSQPTDNAEKSERTARKRRPPRRKPAANGSTRRRESHQPKAVGHA